MKYWFIILNVLFSFIVFASVDVYHFFSPFGNDTQEVLDFYKYRYTDELNYERYYDDVKKLKNQDEIKWRLHILIDKQKYLDYTEARYKMFMFVDNVDGMVECIYTGRKIRPHGIPNSTDMNCEHTFCQSWFFGSESKYMKTDLNQIRPSDSRWNSIRSSHPYGVVLNTKKTSPEGSKLGYDSKGRLVFEPRDKFKGNIARIYFYFSIRYGWKIPNDLEKILRKWHKQDPVDEIEFDRNSRVFETQNNRNPFIDDQNLVDKIRDF